uniref:Collagen alpha-1(I) chain-like n=1 Tax=Strongyloides venezuelensis TaxID=75913 RepID=A0A0K0F3N5_STRVS
MGNPGGLDDNDIIPPKGPQHHDVTSNKIDNGDMTKSNPKGPGNAGPNAKKTNTPNGRNSKWGVVRDNKQQILQMGNGGNGLEGQGVQTAGNRGDSLRGKGPGGRGPNTGGSIRGSGSGMGSGPGNGPMGQQGRGQRGRFRFFQRGSRVGANGPVGGFDKGLANQGPQRGLFGRRRSGVDNALPKRGGGGFLRRHPKPALSRAPKMRSLGRGFKPGGILRFFRG